MTDAEYNQNMQRFRRRHWLHFGVQGGLLGGAALAGRHQAVGLTAIGSRLATWPILLALLVVVPLVSVALYVICRSIKPNLRRPYTENMRIYQSRLVVRNSLLGLLSLPLLAAYLLTYHAGVLVAYGVLLLLLSYQTVPSAQTYQRWLLS